MKTITTLFYKFLLLTFFISSSQLAAAQCGPGQSSLDINIDLTNDAFPDENGWVIVNTNTGARIDSACFGDYASSTGIELVTLCLDTGITYSLYALDDFGDGLDGAEYRLAFTYGSGIDTIGTNNFNIADSLCNANYTNNEIEDSTSFYVPYVAPPSCLAPDSLTASNLTASSVELNWRAINSATQWQIQYDTAGFTLGNGIDSIVNSKPKTINLLSSDTEYDFYVRSICAVGDTSAWSVAGSFKTAFSCPTGAVCATYTLGAIQTDRGFTALPGTSSCPGTISLTIPAGNRIDSITTRYDMTAFALNNAWMSEQRSWLYSVDAATGEASLTSGVGSTNGTFSYERTGITIANGVTGTADFELHAGRTFGGSGCTVDYSAVDNNSWTVIAYYSLTPACLEPLSVSSSVVTGDSAQLNWAATGSATQWIVEWDTAGFTAGTGFNSVIVNTDTFTTITGLTELSTYEFYVRAICGPSDTSSYSPVGVVNTPCSPFTTPFSESFDNTTLPNCWTRSAVTGGPWVFGTPGFTWSNSGCAASTPADNTGNSGNYAALDHSGTDVGVILQLPDVDISGLTIPFLEFYFTMCGNGYTPVNILNVEAYNGVSWDTVSSIQRGTNGWELFGFNLSSFTFNTDLVRIRFRAESGGSTSDWYGDNAIDDVTIDEAPSCPNPANLAANNITSTAVDLAWTENGTATTWEIEFGPAGFAQGTGTDTLITANPFTWIGLSPNTSYDWYVRSVCSVGDTSAWIGKQTFKTLCPASFTAPLFYDFENEELDAPPSCWLEYKSFTNGFVEVEDFTGTAAPFAGSKALYIYSSSGFTQGSDTLIAITPQLSDLSQGDKQIRFQANSDDPITQLIIGTISSPNPSAIFNSIDTINFPTARTYQEVIVQFNTANGYNGTDEYIVFAHNLGASFDYIRIDDLYYEDIPSCPKPSALAASTTESSAILSWTNGGTETEWEIEYDTTGFTQGTGTSINSSTNPDTIAGLTSATTYEFYVRAICTPGDSSIWSGPFSFTTLIKGAVGVNCTSGNATTIFTEEFDTQGAWTGDISSGTVNGDWNFARSGTTTSGNTGPSGAHSGLNYVYFESSTGTSASMVSPAIDLSAAQDFAELSFWLHAYGATIGTLNVGVGTSASGPFTTEFTWSDELQTASADPYQNVGVNLDNYVGDTIYIEFEYIKGSSFTGDLAIDLMEVESCMIPYYSIGTINTEDSLGVADSLNVNCRTSGTVTGVDRRGGGYEFALIDLSSGVQEGITVFDFNDLPNYTAPLEGDSLEIYGSVGQFNGLTQFRPDSIIVLLSGTGTVATPIQVNVLDETTESKLIELIDNFVLLDPSGTFSYNMDATNGIDTITIRVDSDTDVNDSLNVSGNSLVAGDTICGLIGIGGQFDNSSPYTEGYQVFPSRYSDLTICRLSVGLNNVEVKTATFSIVPNPTSGDFIIRTNGFKNESVRIQIRDISGRIVANELLSNANNQINKTMNLNGNAKGIYFINIYDGENVIHKKLILR